MARFVPGERCHAGPAAVGKGRPMRRLVSLLVLGTVVALSAGCAQAGGGTTRVAATPSWAEPSTVDTSASPSVDGSPSGTDASPSASPGTAGTSAAPKPPAPAPPPADSSLVGQLLAQVNSLRAANGLKPYTLASGLNASAHKHNLVMIGGCGLSHRCPGEADLGPRISAQGVSWHSLGENIGESGPNAHTQAAVPQ